VSGRRSADLAEAVPPRLHSLRRAAWLSDDLLLLACVPQDGVGEAVGSLEETVRRSLGVEAKVFVAPLGVIVAAPPVEAEEVTRALTDLRTFLREGPAGWDAATRTDLLNFLARLGTQHGLTASLSDGLRRVREGLRERRPATIEDRRVGRGVAVERLHRIDAHSFYVRGRAWDEVAPIVRLSAISPEGEQVDLLDRVFRHPSLESDFIGFFQIAAPTRGADGWVFEAEWGPGRAVEAAVSLTPDPSKTIFADADLEFDGAEELRERHIRPALTRLNELRCAGADIVELKSHGQVPARPAVSLVIPLQRRIDLIEHQLAQFAADAEIRECELIYVLEDAEEREALEGLAGELFELYGLPFRLATLTEAAGMPTSCNLGASLARAGRLVFLGADVLPDRAGWLGEMAAALDANPDAAATTPKLLFADEAIDQAGLEYSATADGGELSIQPRLRGMHRGIPAAAEAREVAAAGLACLMIDAAEFHEAGGLRSEYGLDPYEGSDLSRRLADRGRELRYVPEAELYRLEGLGAAPEALGERYARWLHSRLWSERDLVRVAL
jgi:GT2 family glycosyltransferase